MSCITINIFSRYFFYNATHQFSKISKKLIGISRRKKKQKIVNVKLKGTQSSLREDVEQEDSVLKTSFVPASEEIPQQETESTPDSLCSVHSRNGS